MKNKKTINPRNNDDNCFQYALTVALNYQNIKKDPQKISKIKPFIDQDIIEKKWSFHHTQKAGKILNKTVRQLLLIFYLYHKKLKK